MASISKKYLNYNLKFKNIFDKIYENFKFF